MISPETILPGGLEMRPQHAQRGDAFSGTGFANQSDHFTRIDRQIDPVDGLRHAGFREKVCAQAADVEQRHLTCHGVHARSALLRLCTGNVCAPLELRELLRIERFTHGLADEDDEKKGKKESRQRKEHQPPLGEVLGALADQLTPAWRRAAGDRTEKVEGDESADIRDDDERGERHNRRERIRQMCLNMIFASLTPVAMAAPT